MKQITNTRKAVCIMANELRKAGYTLAQAFRKAWRRVKESMTVRATGTTFENRQERLQFLRQFPTESLDVSLEQEKENKFDSNAIKIVIHIRPISRRTVIGYIPRGLAKELSSVLERGVEVKAKLMQIIGGYDYKETLGLLLNIAI